MPAKDDPVVIKKYANRRLYNTGTSTYVTLEDLAEMVKKGEDFTVQDAKSGEDLQDHAGRPLSRTRWRGTIGVGRRLHGNGKGRWVEEGRRDHLPSRPPVCQFRILLVERNRRSAGTVPGRDPFPWKILHSSS